MRVVALTAALALALPSGCARLLARVTLMLAPFVKVHRLCGLGDSGCFAPAEGRIVAAADGICGDRMLTLRVERTGAAGGAYTIAVSRP
jgi:hypothetical protein